MNPQSSSALSEFEDLTAAAGASRRALRVELRSFPRFDVDRYVPVKLDDDTELGHLLNISQGGFGVISKRPPDVGTVLSLHLTLPVDGPALREFASVVAQVRWSRPRKIGGVHCVGFEFREVNAKSRLRLDRLIAALADEKREFGWRRFHRSPATLVESFRQSTLATTG